MYEEYLEVLFKYSLKLLLRRQKKSEASTEQQRVSEEQQRASEEQHRASAEQQRASEGQQRDSEEQQRASEEQQRSAVQAGNVNNEDTTTSTRNETVGSKGKDNAESETETQHNVVPNPRQVKKHFVCKCAYVCLRCLFTKSKIKYYGYMSNTSASYLRGPFQNFT